MDSTPEVPQTPDTRNHRSPATVSSSRLRKREADRKAQRIAREKTKNRIAHLESLVEELSRKDDDGKTASLMTQLLRVTEQRNKLMNCLETTSSLFTKQLSDAKECDSKVVSGHAKTQSTPGLVNLDLPEPSAMDFMAPPAATPVPTTSEVTIGDLKNMESDTNNLDVSALDFELPWLNDGFSIETTAAHTSLVGPSSPPPAVLNPAEASSTAKAPCSCSGSIKTRRLSDGSLVNCNNWKAGNTILREPFAISQAVLDLEYQVSEDIPVHAVLHGWDSITQSGRMTPLWKKVRQLDEICFSGCGQPERLGVLFMIHLLMRAYTDPTPLKSSVVPQWYLKSQLQQTSPFRDPSADYFTWPALRYRFATTPHRYCHNLFWHMFKEHLRIAWPFDFRDCYVRNVQLGAYGLSPLFKDRLRDLRAWTMEPDFFVRYPELREDIPKFPGQPSPVTIASQAVGGLTRATVPPPKREENLENDESQSSKEKARSGYHDMSEGGLFPNDIDINANPELLFFQDTFFDTTGPRDADSKISKHKDSSCISL